MMNSSLTVSVVICAYTTRRWEELLKAIDSLQNQDTQPLEIIVVVDHNPSLLERLDPYKTDGVVAFENVGPQGLSGARNSGIRKAKGQVIAFLDDDAVAAPGWLTQLCAAYQDERVMGVGGAITPLWPMEAPSWFPEEFYWIVGCTYRGMPQEPTAVRNLIGCNMSFRRPIVDEIGGFRSQIGRVGTRPVGCEETEFCIRAQQRWPNKFWLYQPTAEVQHHVTPERSTWRYFFARCYSEGLSKAVVTQFVGTNDGLSAERAYTFRTLPHGVLRGLQQAVRGRDPAGLWRAGAIVSGLAATTMGYLVGLLALRFPSTKRHAESSKRVLEGER